MFVLIVHIEINEDAVDRFMPLALENARATRETEPGCRQFDVCRDPDDASLFFLYELYDDEAAVQAHLASPHFLQMNAATAAWVAHKTVRRLQRLPA